jgi:hypothetical protein
VDSQSLQINLERARSLERPHGGFNFGELCLTLVNARLLCPVGELAFEVRPSAVQSVYTTSVWASVNAWRKTDDGEQHHYDRNDEEDDAGDKWAQPEHAKNKGAGRESKQNRAAADVRRFETRAHCHALSAARRIAARMRGYVPQRQIFPLMASSISLSVSLRVSFKSDAACMIWPVWQ